MASFNFFEELKKDWRKLPNKITLARFFLGFLPAAFFVFGLYKVALVIFLSLALTDWVDGWVARKTNQTTAIGRVIDPIADRFMMGLTIFALISKVAAWMAFILAWFVISAIFIGIIMAWAYKNGIHAKPNLSGKMKTVLLSILVACLIAYQIEGFVYLYNIIPGLVVVTLLSSVISFTEYVISYLFTNNH